MYKQIVSMLNACTMEYDCKAMLYRTTQKMCSCMEVYDIWRKLTVSIAIHLNGSCSSDTRSKVPCVLEDILFAKMDSVRKDKCYQWKNMLFAH